MGGVQIVVVVISGKKVKKSKRVDARVYREEHERESLTVSCLISSSCNMRGVSKYQSIVVSIP